MLKLAANFEHLLTNGKPENCPTAQIAFGQNCVLGYAAKLPCLPVDAGSSGLGVGIYRYLQFHPSV